MTGRESHRIKDAEKKRVLDEAARQRRARKALEALEQDNFQDDPHADLVMSKKLPKFQDSIKNCKEKKSKRKGAEYFRAKYRKNFQQLLEEEKQKPNYETASAPPPKNLCVISAPFAATSLNIPVPHVEHVIVVSVA